MILISVSLSYLLYLSKMAKKGSQMDQLNSPNYYKQPGSLSRDLKETVYLHALQSNHQYQEIKQFKRSTNQTLKNLKTDQIQRNLIPGPTIKGTAWEPLLSKAAHSS